MDIQSVPIIFYIAAGSMILVAFSLIVFVGYVIGVLQEIRKAIRSARGYAEGVREEVQRVWKESSEKEHGIVSLFHFIRDIVMRNKKKRSKK